MSLSEDSQQTQSEPGDPSTLNLSTPPSATGIVAANLEKSIQIQEACEVLEQIFSAKNDEDWIEKRLSLAWFLVHQAISQAGGSNLEERLRNKSENSPSC